ncbi:hypothetical protein [Streptomyces sp. NBC_00063]|uniref:hypothetical protein n=1 Tax=Streptomyces sp. NBC_00063 TaxID=2975638 RepID=UPI003D718F32
MSTGQRSWRVRGQNFCIEYTWISTGEALPELDLEDEHVVLVPEETSIRLAVPLEGEVSIDGPALVVVPAGTSRVIADDSGQIMRVFTARATDVLATACNSAMYTAPDLAVAPLPEKPTQSPGTVRIHRAGEIPEEPTRFGRIFRTDSLMINWFEPQDGARDTDLLTPHVHDDFEQASVTLQGDYVHHLRSPWTARLREWRDDQHVRCASPSVTVIPPGNIHTSRAVDAGRHQLVDVFAPPREDFLERGWVVNSTDYEAGYGSPAARAGDGA